MNLPSVDGAGICRWRGFGVVSCFLSLRFYRNGGVKIRVLRKNVPCPQPFNDGMRNLVKGTSYSPATEAIICTNFEGGGHLSK